MENETQSSSTLRFRKKVAAPCTISDTFSTSKRKRGRTRTGKGRLEEEGRSLRYLVAITAILSISIIGGFVYLIYLLLVVDPESLNHLPYLQNYIHDNKSLFSSWRSNSSQFTTFSEDQHNQHLNEPTPQPPSSIYTIPNSMSHIGDKSDAYARLRRDWDGKYPPNTPERSLRAVKDLLATGNTLSSIYDQMRPPSLPSTPSMQNTKSDDKITFDTSADQSLNYDIFNCPDEPPKKYPREYKTIDILKHWPPTQNLPVGKYCHHHSSTTTNKNRKEGDNSMDASCDGIYDGKTAPVTAHLGLCVFDYSRDYEKAMRYRSKEMPFIVRNDPSVAETVERWNDETYRRKLFGSLYHTNSSSNSGGVVQQNKDDDNAKNGALVDDSTRVVYHRAERSITNQVLFRRSEIKKPKKSKLPFSSYRGDQSPTGENSPPMPPPTKLVPMTYDRWYELAMEKEANSTIDTETGIQYYDPNLNGNTSLYYYYFRLVGCGEKEGCERNATEYLFDEMPFFQPRGLRSSLREEPLPNTRVSTEDGVQIPNELLEPSSSHSSQESLYLVQPEKQRGIHCRFGMPGMIAANHYDASRNAITVIGGSRRYIISRPNQCPNLGLYPVGHPSARHSRLDWTTASQDYSNFEESERLLGASNDPSWIHYRKALSRLANNATSTEVILQAGDVLYLPSYWFHFIISLTTNMQCNTRSGRDGRDDQAMTDCGFPPPTKNK